MYKYLKKGCQEDGPGSSQWCWAIRQKPTGRNWCSEVPPNMRKSFFTGHWNRLPRKGVESPSLQIPRTTWTQSGASCSGMALLKQGGWPTVAPSNLSHPVTLWMSPWATPSSSGCAAEADPGTEAQQPCQLHPALPPGRNHHCLTSLSLLAF